LKTRIAIIAACAGTLLMLATSEMTYANYTGVTEPTEVAGIVAAAPAIRLAQGAPINTTRSNIKKPGIAAGSNTPLPDAAINTTRSNIKRPGVAAGDVNGDGRADLRKGGKTGGSMERPRSIPGGNKKNNALTDGLMIIR
jgi:hypothetical protein